MSIFSGDYFEICLHSNGIAASVARALADFDVRRHQRDVILQRKKDRVSSVCGTLAILYLDGTRRHLIR